MNTTTDKTYIVDMNCYIVAKEILKMLDAGMHPVAIHNTESAKAWQIFLGSQDVMRIIVELSDNHYDHTYQQNLEIKWDVDNDAHDYYHGCECECGMVKSIPDSTYKIDTEMK